MDQLWEVADYVVFVVLGLLPIANPFSTAPVFLTLTGGFSTEERARLARLTCFYMAGILLAFFLAGTLIMNFFGITIEGVRVAGGLILAYLGFRMLFPPAEVADSASTQTRLRSPNSLAFTPLAMPLLSGPGSIAVIIGMSAQIADEPEQLQRVLAHVPVVLGILITTAICWAVLRASPRVVKFLGDDGIDALTRIMGFFLICIAVQFVEAGVTGFIDRAA